MLGDVSLSGKTKLVIIRGHSSADRYWDEILQPVAIPYLHSLGPNSILKDDNTHPHTAGFIRDYLQNLGVERMEGSASCPDINPTEHLWDQLGCVVRARETNTTTLSNLQQMVVEEWDTIQQQWQPGWCPAWGGGAGLLWLCISLPHTTEAPVQGIHLNC